MSLAPAHTGRWLTPLAPLTNLPITMASGESTAPAL